MNAKSPGKFRNSTTSESLLPAYLTAFFQLKVLYTFETKTHTTSNIEQQQSFYGRFPGLRRSCPMSSHNSFLTSHAPVLPPFSNHALFKSCPSLLLHVVLGLPLTLFTPYDMLFLHPVTIIVP